MGSLMFEISDLCFLNGTNILMMTSDQAAYTEVIVSLLDSLLKQGTSPVEICHSSLAPKPVLNGKSMDVYQFYLYNKQV